MNLLLEDAKLIDGKSINIEIKNGKISRIEEKKIDVTEGYKKINLQGKYISSGWIDSHAHIYPAYKPYSSDPDSSGYMTGVTAVIDAGTCGADDIDIFYGMLKKYKTKVFALLNISKIGLSRMNELSDLKNIDFDLVDEYLRKYSDFLVGIKARISKSIVKENGIKPLKLATNYIKNKDLNLMVHIGNGPPTIKEILKLLGKNCIISHYLNGKENNILEDGKVMLEFLEAMERGMKLDIAHGTASFSFNVAKVVKESGIRLDLISTDIYDSNRENGPVYSLAKVMTKLLYLGYSLEEIIDSVTRIPSKLFKLKNMGEIKIGNCADFTIFEIVKKEVELVDSTNKKINYGLEIVPRSVVIDGEYIEI